MLVSLFALTGLLRWGAIRQPLGSLHVMVLSTLAYIFAWSGVGWLSIRHASLEGPIMVEAIGTVLIWVAVLFVGACLPTSSRALPRLSGISFATVLLCFGHSFYIGGFPMGPFLAFASGGEDAQVTYQGVGRSLLIIGLLAAFASRPRSVTSLFILLGMGLLLLSLGSRAHFFVLGVSLFVHLTVLVTMRSTRVIGVLGLLITAIALTSVVSVFLETRAAEILDLTTSSSWEGRSIAMSRALEVISEYPLTGLFGYHFWDSSGYAHNVLSAWTQYGFWGFVAFTATLVFALYIATAGLLLSRGRDPGWYVALHFNFVAILLAIFSEPIMSSVFPALAWGLTMRAQSMSRAAFAATKR